jgi:sugar diacid utilization regulator
VASDLQLLVDQLSARVGAAALLEDHEQRPVVFSRQLGPIDAVRRDSILHRSTSPELMSWFRSFGILRARRALRIPAHPELDILARVCAPAWYRDRLLGFLWLIADEEAICDGQLAEIEKAADHAALMLYEERLAQRLVVQALTHLFSPSEELRDAAASQLIDQSLLREGEPTAVVVLQALPPSDQNLAVIEEALLDVGWEAPTGALLRLACSDHGVMLVRLKADNDDTFAATMAQAGRDALCRRLADGPEPAPRVVATIGDPQNEPRRAVSSYRQARLATKVASAIPAIGDLVRWRDLGVFRALAQLPNREAVESALDPRVAALLKSGDQAVVSTLETYLDLAGDAKATAEYLHLHRGTLYYRLDKAQRLAGIDVHNGYDRLAVHLGLKLARLAGAAPGGQTEKTTNGFAVGTGNSHLHSHGGELTDAAP